MNFFSNKNIFNLIKNFFQILLLLAASFPFLLFNPALFYQSIASTSFFSFSFFSLYSFLISIVVRIFFINIFLFIPISFSKLRNF